MFWNIDIKNGNVTYDDISFLTEEFNSKDQVDYLKEDMLQIEFPEDILFDVGWRPSFDEEGAFYVSVIKGLDWESPILQKKVSNITEVRKVLSDFVKNI